MDDKQTTFECAHCGYKADDKFTGDICPECGLTFWKCDNCGFLITASAPPNTCPSCKETCEFRNVSCYTPDCGGPGKVDRRLV